MYGIHPIYSLLLLITFGSCSNNPVPDKTNDTSKVDKKDPVSGGYVLAKPNHTWRLPDQLVEVSGNSWLDASHLILIEDLHPALYLIKLDDKKATLEKTVPFAEM